nr:hypothetical protein BaRGS_012345 [Batillaria attramentaria]
MESRCVVIDQYLPNIPSQTVPGRMEKCNHLYLNIVKGLSDREANDALNAFVSKGNQQHDDIQMGMLYNILVEPTLNAKVKSMPCFRDMMLVARDGLTGVVNKTCQLVYDKWSRLSEPTRAQIIGIMQLMQVRTSRRFLISRLTPDMEVKLVFLISKVKFGQQKRYQDWFQRQYLSTPESQSLRCDLIRYICAVFHPSNDLLCSDIIPRWAVIGWLLTTCTSNVAASDAKLALFYDWLVFEPERDSIMNIVKEEPGLREGVAVDNGNNHVSDGILSEGRFSDDEDDIPLDESLEWESIEQYFLWQLITAHNIPTEHILPVLPKLEYSELLRPVLCRECKKTDFFVVSVLKYWAQEHEDRLAELINSQLTRINGTTSSKKRQKFSDLLALAEDIEDIKTTRVLRGRRTANSSPKMSKTKRPVPEDSGSSSDSSEDESMKNPPKKKKKTSQPAIDDDSD